MSLLSYLPQGMQRAVQRRARARKYHGLWTELLRRAARERIPAGSLSRVHLFLRSHYDKTLIPRADPLQNPATGYFPGLRARPLWQPSEIAWTALLEEAYPQIKAEYDNMTRSVELRPHPQSDDETSWRVKYFYLLGEEQPEAQRLCPKTSAILKSCLPSGPSNQVFFSVLGKQAHIDPHCGAVNTRLTCHLGLTVTPDSALRVGSNVVSWQDGKCLVFDDSFEHEVWNKSDRERVVLLIQLWHPDLTEAEVWALKELRPLLATPGYKEAALGGKRIGH
ncbi:MAG TPA: aspartyl/asparaginyl beta-hydroxylase domain-containing protein [Aestuariivirgaceae bacterium]